MKPRKYSLFSPAILGITLVSTAVTFSQVIWDGETDSEWATGSNWGSDVGPVLDEDVLIDTSGGNQPAISSAIDLGIGTVTVGSSNLSNSSLMLGLGGSLTSGSVTLAANAGSIGSLLIGDGVDAGSLSLTGGLIGGDGNASLIFNHADAAYDFSTSVSGTLTIFHQGSGTTILSGTNTFVGDTNLLSGVLAIDSNARLGDAANQVVFDGGALRLDGSFDLQRAMTLNAGGGSIDAGANNVTLSGDISGIGSLTLDSEGTLTLAGTNSYQGGTIINGGTVSISSDGNLGNAAGGLSFQSGGTLEMTAGVTSVRNVTLDGGSTFHTADGDSVFSGDFTGSGGLVKSGSGSLSLTGTNTFLGDTSILSGVLAIDSNARLGDAANQVIFDGGALRLDGSFDLQRAMTLNAGGGSIDAGVNNVTLSGGISGSGPLSLDSEGTLTFAGNNKSYSGATSLLQGTLLVQDSGGLSANSALALSSGTVVDASGTATQTVAGLSGSGDLVLGSDAFSVNSAADETFSGIISGAGSLSKAGAGKLTLDGVNSYLGGTLIDGSTISISSDDNLGNAAGVLSFQGGGTLEITAGVTSARNVTLDGGSTFHAAVGDSVFSGDFTGSGGLFKSGSGSLSLTGNNTFFGDTTILSGALSIDSETRLGDVGNKIIFDGGSLLVDGVIDMQRGIVVNAGGGGIDSGINDITFSSDISGNGALALSSEGTLTFAGTNKTHTGATSLLQGTLLVNESGGLSAASALSLASGTVLDASNAETQTVAGLSGSGDLVLGSGAFTVNSAANGTFVGNISGDGSLSIAGAGKLTLGGMNTYLGGTLIDGTDGAVLSISSDNNLGDISGGLAFQSGGTLEMTADVTTARSVVLDGGSVLRATSGISTFSGEISGTGGLTKTGAGTLSLTGTNTYTGDTMVSQGTLSAASDSAFGNAAGNILLADGATLANSSNFSTLRTLSTSGSSVNLDVATGTTLTLDGAITGTAGISKKGAGTLLLNGMGLNDYAGNTTIVTGEIRAGAAGVFNSTSNVLVDKDTSLNLDGFDQTIGSLEGLGSVLLGAGTLTTDTAQNSTLSGVISGFGSLVKSGTGALTLLNTTNSYSGGTTVNGGGTLIIGANENLGSGNLVLDDGTLKLSSSPTVGVSMSRSTVLESGGGTFDTTGRVLTMSGLISGDGVLTKVGTGTLVLGNSGNSYTGGTILNGGAIQISSDGALGDLSGAVTLGGGKLIVNGTTTTVTSSRDYVGTGALIKEGTGILHLTGTGNNYSGGTEVNEGILRFNENANLGDIGAGVTLGGGTLSAAATLTSSRGIALTDDSKFEVLTSQTATWDGDITGTHILTKTGSGTLIASGNNLHSGFNVSSGTLQISSDANVGGVGSSVSVNGGILQFGASAAITRDINLGSATLDTNGHDVALSIQSISGYSYSTVTKTGAGALTVLSSNKNGTFQVNAGVLRPGDSNALATHEVINLAGVGSSLELNGTNANIRSLAGVSGSTVDLGFNTLTILGNSYSTTYSGDIIGTGSLVKSGSETQYLAGTNTYSGGTVVSGGALIFNNASAVSASGLITNTAYTGAGFAMDQAFLERFDKANSTGVLGVQTSTANNLSLAGFHPSASLGTNATGVTVSGAIIPQGSTYRIAGGYGQMNLASDLSGARDLYVDSLRVNLSGNNTLTNGITAGSNGVVVFDNAASLPGAGSLKALSNGYIGNATAAIDQTFLDRFDKSSTQGVIGLNVDSTNSLDLTGFGSGASLGTTGSVTLSGTITPQGANYRFGGVSAYSRGTMTLASNLTGAHGLDVGYIDLILTGNNSYSGTTTVSYGGTVQVDADSRLGSGKLILSGGTYQTTASFSSAREIQLASYGTIRTSATLTQNGNLTGNGFLYKEGFGTLVLNGNNQLDGAYVANGVLRFGSENAINSNAELYIDYFGTVELADTSRSIDYLHQWGGILDLGSANLTINSGNLYDGTIQGTGSLTKTSTGSLYIYQTNAHSGGTTLQEGSSYITTGGAFGTGTLSLSGGSLTNNAGTNTVLTLANNVSVTANTNIMTGSGENSGMTFNGSLSGSGNITKTGEGKMTLAGNSSHTGTITVASGLLNLTGSTGSNLVANTSTSLITGDGDTSGLISVSNGGIVAPGNSPGTLGVGALVLGPGGIYDWEISNISIYDSIDVSGNISITSTTLNPFLIRVHTLDGSNDPGIMAGFNMASDYAWVLASGFSISGFNASKFELDLSGFHNPADLDRFSLKAQAGNLLLTYTAPAAAVPEPSGIFLLAIGIGGAVFRRRRGD